jgi:hypothetical protein
MSELSPENKIYLQYLKSHLVKLENNCFYTVQRLDIVIIILATSAILFLTNLIQSLFACQAFRVNTLKVSVSFFVLSIVANLLSQVVSNRVNEKHRVITEKKIADLEYRFKVGEYGEEDEKANKQNKFVHWLNHGSLLSLIIGIVIATVFFWTL